MAIVWAAPVELTPPPHLRTVGSCMEPEDAELRTTIILAMVDSSTE